jgi:hypothetical protein
MGVLAIWQSCSDSPLGFIGRWAYAVTPSYGRGLELVARNRAILAINRMFLIIFDAF